MGECKNHTCFLIVDNPTNNVSEIWKIIILRKISKNELGILDEYDKSVLDTVTDEVEEGCHVSM